MGKTEVRLNLYSRYRQHWISAFMKLKYNKNLTDKQNEDLFFNWIYSVNWEEVKELMFKHQEVKNDI